MLKRLVGPVTKEAISNFAEFELFCLRVPNHALLRDEVPISSRARAYHETYVCGCCVWFARDYPRDFH